MGGVSADAAPRVTHTLLLLLLLHHLRAPDKHLVRHHATQIVNEAMVTPRRLHEQVIATVKGAARLIDVRPASAISGHVTVCVHAHSILCHAHTQREAVSKFCHVPKPCITLYH